MQRVSNVLFTVALTVCVLLVSATLVVVAWLMTSVLIYGPVRPTFPKWLFMSVLVISIGSVAAHISDQL